MKQEDAQPPWDLRDRTLEYASSVVSAFVRLPKSEVASVLGKQMLRSGTSVGSQYREGHRAKSINDKISKLEGALQELEETTYWIELLGRHQFLPPETANPLQDETNQLTAILVTIVTKLKRGR